MEATQFKLGSQAGKLAARLLLGAFAALVLALPAEAQAGIPNPVPFIQDPLVPASAAPGGPAFTLTVNGTGFVPSSLVNWNGVPLATTYVSGIRLTAGVEASAIASPGTACITVSSPGPGGGSSALAFFPIATPREFVYFHRTAQQALRDNIELAVADFNGDGRLDLASACWDESQTAIFLGNGDGTFQPYQSYQGCGAHGLATGDFSGDGIADLAVANRGCWQVSLLLGNGDGTFTYGPSPDTPGGLFMISAGDFNSDGRLDLVSANEGGQSVSVFLGNGDGTFQPPADYDIGAISYKVISADFNGDGRLDLAVSTIDSYIAILIGNGDGTFQPRSVLPTEHDDILYLDVADLNGDGRPDLAAVSRTCWIFVLLGNGDGTFLSGGSYETDDDSWNPMTIVAADFNGDGILDLVAANQWSVPGDGSFSLFLGKGDGTFMPRFDYPAAGTPRGLAAADFDGDGKLDLAVGNQGQNSVSIFLALDKPEVPSGTWIMTENMSFTRYYHSATLLRNGKVLVAGGWASTSLETTLASAELYDPGTGTWTLTGSMNIPRHGHVATLLGNGNVLVAGGWNQGQATDSAEFYDPITGSWTLTGSMSTQRVFPIATLISKGPSSGKVLVAAGSSVCGGCPPVLDGAELYDPDNNTWSLTGSMTIGRYFEGLSASAATLPDGSVLAVGGTTCCPYFWFNQAETYDPQSETWTPTATKNTEANGCVAVMANGQALVAGGWSGTQGSSVFVADAELFDSASGTWTATASMSTVRDAHTLTTLGNGKVLAAGGESGGWGVCHKQSSAELYDSNTGKWSLAGSMNHARGYHTATLLLDGRVLVAGGMARNEDCSGQAFSSAELFVPPDLCSCSAQDDTATTDEDTAVEIYVLKNDTDSEGDKLTVEFVIAPQNGTVVMSGDSTYLTYMPKPNFYGTDFFAYAATDGKSGTATATVIVRVKPINDPPVAKNLSVSTVQDWTVSFTLTATDIENDAFAFVIVSQPTHGSLGGAAPHLMYAPTKDFYGTDTFTFKANDGRADSNVATVTIDVGQRVRPGDHLVLWNTLGSGSELQNSLIGPPLIPLQTLTYFDALLGGGVFSHNKDPIVRLPQTVLNRDQGTIVLRVRLIDVPAFFFNAQVHSFIGSNKTWLTIDFTANDGMGHSGWLARITKEEQLVCDVNSIDRFGTTSTESLGAEDEDVFIAVRWNRNGVPGHGSEKLVLFRNKTKIGSYREYDSWVDDIFGDITLNCQLANPAVGTPDPPDLDLIYDDIKVYDASLADPDIMDLARLTQFHRGDANADGATDLSDAVAILFHLFMAVNIPCEQAGDANDDGALDISDAIYLLSFLFLGGKPIEPPVGTCGIDLSGHDLPCSSFPGCK